MIIGRILSPVHSLGPGERVCVWTQGCQKKCEGCISGDLQPFIGEDIQEAVLYQIIKQLRQQGNCTGLTISGGDPFEQPAALLTLLKLVRDEFNDILVYTGFTVEEIYEGVAGKEGVECLGLIDVLIDGRYIKYLNKSDCVLRGSQNQRVHFLNPDVKSAYSKYMEKGRMLETFVHNDNVIITGILNEEENQ